MGKKKTLSQELTDFLKPQNLDFDIEDETSDKGSDKEVEEEAKDHYVDMGKSRLRKAKKELVVDKKYSGETVSAKELWSERKDEESREEVSERADESEASESFGSASESDNEDKNDPLNVSESGSESEGQIVPDVETENPESDAAKRNKIKELMDTDNKSNIKRVSDAAELDALKGFHVHNQRSLFDWLVDSRIKFQKALTSTNQFPQSLENFETDKTSEFFKKTEDSLYNLLDTISDLRLSLYKKSNLQDSKKPKKRTFEEYSNSASTLDSVLNKHRDKVLTKWSQKVQAASGSAVLNAAKFNAINQTAAVQVENNLTNIERLVKRTRLNRRDLKPLDYEGDSSSSSKFDDPALAENPNIFDDEDFYRLLLRDLIDNKVNSSVSVNEASLITLNKAKLKKKVDTKASKGRKLNYKPQDPLVNYMSSRRVEGRWDNYQIDEFFVGLFGQKVDMDEEEKLKTGSEEDIAIVNDNIQLFA